MLDQLRQEAQRLEEGVLHYEDANRVAANGWRRVAYCLGFGAAAAGAVTASLNLQDAREAGAAGAIAAVITALLAASLAFFRPQDRETANRSAAAELNVLRHQLRRFQTIDCAVAGSPEQLRQRFDELVKRRDTLVPRCTDYSGRSFERARKRIESGIFDYAVDSKSERTQQ